MLISLLKLLLLLAAVAQGIPTSCNITKAQTSVECYGVLGEPVYIHLNINSNFSSFDVKLNDAPPSFINYRKINSRFTGLHKDHCNFSSDGVLQLDNLTQCHSGSYTLEVFDQDGRITRKTSISLTIQAPVSRPLVSQLCLPHGEIKSSCSSTGDHPEYNWTLDYLPLNGTKAFLSNETQTVILKKGVSGSITCTVSNRVSKNETTQELLQCPGLDPPVKCTLQNETEITLKINASFNVKALLHNRKIFFFMNGESVPAVCSTTNQTADDSSQKNQNCGKSNNTLIFAILGVCVLLLALLLGTCCLYKKQQKQPKMNQRMGAENSEDHQDLVYCQVQVVKRERPNRKAQEPGVVYGEVKVSDSTRRAPKEQEETVYSSVRK